MKRPLGITLALGMRCRPPAGGLVIRPTGDRSECGVALVGALHEAPVRHSASSWNEVLALAGGLVIRPYER